jgi:CheY-like chemotaxis protein/nitrogen-specific signal transduction histidine kinase
MSTNEKLLKNINTQFEKSLMQKSIETNNSLSMMIDSTDSFSIFILDKEYRYVMMNTYHRRLMKKLLDIDVKIGTSILAALKICTITDLQRNIFIKIKDKLDFALKGNKFTTNEELLMGNNKIKYYKLEFTPIKDLNNNITGVGVFTFDITKNVRKVKECLKAKSDIASENMEKSKFLSNMSHEIRTPINGIIGLADITLNDKLNDKQIKFIKAIKDSASSLLETIDNILYTSKIDSGRFQIIEKPFNFYKLIERLNKMFLVNQTEKGIDINYEIDTNIAKWLVGDELKLQQILIDLIGNAIYFSKQGKIKVKVQLKNENISYKETRRIKLKFNITYITSNFKQKSINNNLEILNNSEIQADEYEEIFNKFIITKQLVKCMGGHISINSNINIGNQLTFELPFQSIDDKLPMNQFLVKNTYKDKKSIVSHKEDKNISILVAEDNMVNQMVISELIQINGWSSKIVNNGQQAIKALEEDHYDLIFMDISMPVMDGIEAMKIIKKKKQWRHIPIIALTAYALVQDKEKFIQLGMDDYLSKPIDGNKLYSMVIRHLNLQDNKSKNIKESIDEDEYNEGFKRLEKILDGNTELISELGQKIVDMFSKDEMNKIIDLAENKNILELREILHKLKGAVSNFQLIKIQKLLTNIKKSAVNEDMYSIYKLVEEINENIKLFDEKLRFYKNNCQ